jgi:hypothetical protein
MEYAAQRPAESAREHLREALELAEDAEQRRHIRESLQLIEKLDDSR